MAIRAYAGDDHVGRGRVACTETTGQTLYVRLMCLKWVGQITPVEKEKCFDGMPWRLVQEMHQTIPTNYEDFWLWVETAGLPPAFSQDRKAFLLSCGNEDFVAAREIVRMAAEEREQIVFL